MTLAGFAWKCIDLHIWQASSKGVSKGEGKQGKGSGKSVPEKNFAPLQTFPSSCWQGQRTRARARARGVDLAFTARPLGGQHSCCTRRRHSLELLGGL